MAIGINAELRVAEIVKDSAERLAINDDLVGSFGKIGENLLLLERMLGAGVLL